MRRLFGLLAIVILFPLVIYTQARPAWVEKTATEAEKLLNDSAWAQTQTDTDTSELFYSPTRPGTASIAQVAQIRPTTPDQQAINNNRADRGATNGAVEVNYHIRLFSAKPIREAISRVVLLNQVEPSPSLIDMMQTLVDRDFSQWIVVTVTCDATDGRFLGPSLQAFASATAETLRNTTYLERKDGKRLYLFDYRAPQSDGLGAKFVFQRNVDGKAFVTEKDGSLRFYSEFNSKLKLNVKYKLADMVVDGRLEY